MVGTYIQGGIFLYYVSLGRYIAQCIKIYLDIVFNLSILTKLSLIQNKFSKAGVIVLS